MLSCFTSTAIGDAFAIFYPRTLHYGARGSPRVIKFVCESALRR